MSDEDDEDWEKPISVKSNLDISYSDKLGSLQKHNRVIIHIDVDCFYAQVESANNAYLQSQPLGIYQKSYLATSNYAARDKGVKKGMSVKEAKQACPALILINGEDLTPYRDVSYKVTELMKSGWGEKVERLGLDENYIDVSDAVEKRVRRVGESEMSAVSGHLYPTDPAAVSEVGEGVSCSCGCHQRLNIGSHIASDIRHAMYTHFNLTTCAGIAHNKLLAKLIGSSHKPNQQTTIYPEYADEFMRSLGSVKNITGIGSSTGDRLASVNINTVSELQWGDRVAMCKVMDSSRTVDALIQLAHGVDHSAVRPAGPPQSLAEEDACKVTSVEEVDEKLNELLTSVIRRLREDGRIAGTLKVTVRQLSPAARQSRQTSISPHLFHVQPQAATSPTASERGHVSSDALRIRLKQVAWTLLDKMIPNKSSFTLTLIGVGFTNLTHTMQQAVEKNVIVTLFAKQSVVSMVKGYVPAKSALCESSVFGSCSSSSSAQQVTGVASQLPEEIDGDVFSQLPASVQDEILRDYKYAGTHVAVTGRRTRPAITGTKRKSPVSSSSQRKKAPCSQGNILSYFKKEK